LAIAVNRQLVFSIRLDPQDAAARRQRKEAELNALNNGVSVLPENGDGHRSVAAAAAQFLEETELTKKPRTLNWGCSSAEHLGLHHVVCTIGGC